MFKALIVDDESKARRNLANVLQSHTDFVIAAEADNTDDALKLLLSEKPDLVFLDIKMPQADGFSFLDNLIKLGVSNTAVIFLTAFDEYALKAIKYAVFDYLLKPVDPEELEKTLNRFRARKVQDTDTGLAKLREMLDIGNKIKFITRNGYIFLSSKQILYIKGEGSYSNVFDTDNQTHLVSRNLKEMEDQLDPATFIRVHKSYLISKHYLASYDKKNRSCTLVKENVTVTIPVSFRYAKNISL
jgi:two-component system, LytTR family, response regulator